MLYLDHGPQLSHFPVPYHGIIQLEVAILQKKKKGKH